MTKTPFFIIFFTVILSFIFVLFFKSNYNAKFAQETSKYRSNLRTASTTALAIAIEDVNEPNLCIYDNESIRQKSVDSFFKTLSKCFNYEGDSNRENLLLSYVPVICLIDRNGYYICYNMPYHSDDGVLVQNEITPINTWATQSSDEVYAVQFILGTDYQVFVTNNITGETQSGTYNEIYEYFGSPESLEMLSSFEKYEAAKNDTVINETTEKIENYINQYNFRVNSLAKDANSKELHYRFEMPEIDNEDWCGLMDQPGVIAFLQGNYFTNNYFFSQLNVYSINGVETAIKQPYVVKEDENGHKIYHRSTCIDASDEDDKYGTKEECAKVGAYPCDKCNP